jgi:hypothetical protein
MLSGRENPRFFPSPRNWPYRRDIARQFLTYHAGDMLRIDEAGSYVHNVIGDFQQRADANGWTDVRLEQVALTTVPSLISLSSPTRAVSYSQYERGEISEIFDTGSGQLATQFVKHYLLVVLSAEGDAEGEGPSDASAVATHAEGQSA